VSSGGVRPTVRHNTISGLLLCVLAVLLGYPPVGWSADAGFFRSAAPELGIDFVHFTGMVGRLYVLEVIGSGVSLLDYDGDGDLDAYFVQGNLIEGEESLDRAIFPPRHPLPLTDRLYRNDLELLADGSTRARFVDVTDKIGLAAHGYGMGVAAGDVDNDGWIDLYVTNHGPNHLLRNIGDGTFTDVIAESGADDRRWGASAAIFDYDRDGWLDIFVGNYVEFSLATHQECSSPMGKSDYCGPLVFPSQGDSLLHNNGDGTFENVTIRLGLSEEYGSALGVVTSDFNGDGNLDIYVANDHMANQMWMSQPDGTFLNDAMFAGSAVNADGEPEASMGVVVGDIDGDSHDDIFLSHIGRETNTLYLNDGQGLFRDATRASGLGMASWEYTGFGTALLDYDNDGWQDLFVANGAVQVRQELVAAGDPLPLREPNMLFRNVDGGRFEDVTAASGVAVNPPKVGRGVAAGDLDNDGDTDMLISNNAESAEALVNQVGERSHWLGLRLIDSESGRDLVGTRVAATLADGSVRWRRSATEGSYLSSNTPRVLFGLGENDRVAKLRAYWPNGTITEFRDVPVDSYINVRR